MIFFMATIIKWMLNIVCFREKQKDKGNKVKEDLENKESLESKLA